VYMNREKTAEAMDMYTRALAGCEALQDDDSDHVRYLQAQLVLLHTDDDTMVSKHVSRNNLFGGSPALEQTSGDDVVDSTGSIRQAGAVSGPRRTSKMSRRISTAGAQT
jgi:hypothetical protein